MKIAIIGYGKMGRTIEKIATKEKIEAVVCGTTGWLDNFDLVKKYCEEKETAFIYSSNFSFGVNIFFKVNKYLASLMNKYDSPYRISIEETHHKEKLDSPSGTAISLANDIIDNNNSIKSWTKS